MRSIPYLIVISLQGLQLIPFLLHKFILHGKTMPISCLSSSPTFIRLDWSTSIPWKSLVRVLLENGSALCHWDGLEIWVDQGSTKNSTPEFKAKKDVKDSDMLYSISDSWVLIGVCYQFPLMCRILDLRGAFNSHFQMLLVFIRNYLTLVFVSLGFFLG